MLVKLCHATKRPSKAQQPLFRAFAMLIMLPRSTDWAEGTKVELANIHTAWYVEIRRHVIRTQLDVASIQSTMSC